MRIAFICLSFAFIGCSETQEIVEPDSRWSVLWQLEGEEITGDLLLMNNQNAELQVRGVPQSLLVNESAGVQMHWAMNKDQLVLTRLDNNIELKYEIIERNSKYMKLSYADDIIVKLYRH